VIALLIILIAVIVGRILGGDIRRLVVLRLRGEGVLIVALTGQFVLPRVAHEFGYGSEIQYWLWMIPALLVVGTAILNLNVTGMSLMALGVALNALVISVNYGMPVLDTAVSVAGLNELIPAIESTRGFYFVAGEHTPLLILADVLPVAGPEYIRTILSLGDMLLFVGVAVLLMNAMLVQDPSLGKRIGSE